MNIKISGKSKKIALLASGTAVVAGALTGAAVVCKKKGVGKKVKNAVKKVVKNEQDICKKIKSKVEKGAERCKKAHKNKCEKHDKNGNKRETVITIKKGKDTVNEIKVPNFDKCNDSEMNNETYKESPNASDIVKKIRIEIG